MIMIILFYLFIYLFYHINLIPNIYNELQTWLHNFHISEVLGGITK